MEIKSRYGGVLFKDDSKTMKETVEAAVREGNHLHGARLYKAVLGGAKLRKAILSGAALSKAYLIYADLRGAGLAGADLEGANLEQ